MPKGAPGYLPGLVLANLPKTSAEPKVELATTLLVTGGSGVPESPAGRHAPAEERVLPRGVHDEVIVRHAEGIASFGMPRRNSNHNLSRVVGLRPQARSQGSTFGMPKEMPEGDRRQVGPARRPEFNCLDTTDLRHAEGVARCASHRVREALERASDSNLRHAEGADTAATQRGGHPGAARSKSRVGRSTSARRRSAGVLAG